MKSNTKKKRFPLFSGFIMLLWGGLIMVVLTFSFNKTVAYTSTDNYCTSCHVHPDADESWLLSAHNNNRTGVKVHCVECHLPPKEDGMAAYTYAKAKHGLKDVYGYFFKDTSEIDWKAKRFPEIANGFVYEASCIKCHSNFYPATLSDEGNEAHLGYELSPGVRSCITCHIDVGHYDPMAHALNMDFGLPKDLDQKVFEIPQEVSTFEHYTEKIPGTTVSFNMKAIPGGKFLLGSPPKQPFHQLDEIPQRQVKVSNFFMGEFEVSWEEYLAFFNATASQGRKEAEQPVDSDVDGISGATPPWGAPDQGWGKGKRPAITMSYYAAETYCKWLSQVTGKNYRLPTEAEWEYAARGGTQKTYFFDGEVKDFERKGIWNKLFGPDTTLINSYIVYQENSPQKTQKPEFVLANPFGLKNMLGNVAEFCLDYYDPAVYGRYPKGIINNPRGPRNGKEHVVRGGSFSSSATDLRISNRDYTKTNAWLVTDPQMPKSIWWYSDCKNVGFRVICEFDEKTGNPKKIQNL